MLVRATPDLGKLPHIDVRVTVPGATESVRVHRVQVARIEVTARIAGAVRAEILPRCASRGIAVAGW